MDETGAIVTVLVPSPLSSSLPPRPRALQLAARVRTAHKSGHYLNSSRAARAQAGTATALPVAAFHADVAIISAPICCFVDATRVAKRAIDELFLTLLRDSPDSSRVPHVSCAVNARHALCVCFMSHCHQLRVAGRTGRGSRHCSRMLSDAHYNREHWQQRAHALHVSSAEIASLFLQQ
eukprot:IDg17983t1